MNQEAIQKLKLARKYQKEAMMELIPPEIRGNVANIEKELKEILIKTVVNGGADLMKAFMSEDSAAAETEESAEKVKKVVID